MPRVKTEDTNGSAPKKGRTKTLKMSYDLAVAIIPPQYNLTIIRDIEGDIMNYRVVSPFTGQELAAVDLVKLTKKIFKETYQAANGDDVDDDGKDGKEDTSPATTLKSVPEIETEDIEDEEEIFQTA